MARTFRKKPNKKYLIEERKLDVEAPDFHTMSREELLNYIDYEKPTFKKKRRVFESDDF